MRVVPKVIVKVSQIKNEKQYLIENIQIYADTYCSFFYVITEFIQALIPSVNACNYTVPVEISVKL
jgi:hypothetical protein